MPDSVHKEQAMQYLKRKDFHQVLRNEILWGLIPKIFSGLWFKIFYSWLLNVLKSWWKAKTQNQRLAQQHDVELTMKVLQNEGFLRGPGLLQLETIQMYFNIIDEKPRFKVHKKKVTDFCSEGTSISC